MSVLPPLDVLSDGMFNFSIDRGGTFTDIYCLVPTTPTPTPIVYKLLSQDPSNYADAPTEGIRRVMKHYLRGGTEWDRGKSLPVSNIKSIRMGTTVATNALLERAGSRTLLLTTSGYGDVLQVGNQSRPDIFDLTITKRSNLYEASEEIDERVAMLTDKMKAQEGQDWEGEVKETVTGETVRVIRPVDVPKVREILQKHYDNGVRSVAVVLMHSYLYPDHEVAVGEVCREVGYTQVTLSHETSRMVKLVPRGQTTVASAYLTPSITDYLKGFKKGFEDSLMSKVSVTFMKSDGGLTRVGSFSGHQAILSGPAGGVVGYAKTSYSRYPPSTPSAPPKAVIGFDMGGTSTDVSRYGGVMPTVYETTTAGVTVMTPQLDINTVAAGGGSKLTITKGGVMQVGPESVGSQPGPVCYRKGGSLAVTDANAVTGRVVKERFPKIFGPNEDEPLDEEGSRDMFKKMIQDAGGEIGGMKTPEEGYKDADITTERFLNLRYEGTDTAIFTKSNEDGTDFWSDYGNTFSTHYQREFGFDLDRDVIVDDYRVQCIVPGPSLPSLVPPTPLGPPPPSAFVMSKKAYFEGGWQDVKVYDLAMMSPGHQVSGPAIIVQDISTIVVEDECEAIMNVEGDLEINQIKEDPVMLSIFGHRFMGIAESMGKTLQRTSVSVNIKERLDFSCALFGPGGGLVANAPHIPVHLGAMQEAVSYQIKHWGLEGMQPGEVFVSNHPQLAGGSHLPDITVITPVFRHGKIVFFVASRGHHSDIGGIAPGSMPPNSTTLLEEGAQIIATKLVKDGVFQEQAITEILNKPPYPTRNLRDNLSDLRAQVAANQMGIRLVNELITEYDLPTVQGYMGFIQRTAEGSVRAMLKETAAALSSTSLTATDYMDDGTPIKLTITIDPDTGSATFDFTGTGPQVLGNHNAPPAVTYSAVIYSLRCLVSSEIPLNQGCLNPIRFIIPPGSILNPSPDAAVVGGNVLTSQRLVDVILKAFKACAASQGCMNNLTFGNEGFGYYETIAGGHGAGPTWDGKHGVHTHCTNTRITDPEILERRYPVMLHKFEIRKGSGGTGRRTGGCGLTRVIEPLEPLVMSILSERRSRRPYGMAGGGDGATGVNLLKRKGGNLVNIGGKATTNLGVGDLLIIQSPGGGGYGKAAEEGEKVEGEETQPAPSFEGVGNGSLQAYKENQFSA
ncbi:hypothetical protein TrRE_jg3563 [Triparma retinervis]|uniref:5-oxoprolinase n=1 Tax=Triparma retinervis TaxID=2557542 RepID=A0A9W7DYQ5_9STRA|nr:hypothetical protein TrRE_jg3563 [Triparma retinervis]